eukprot:5008368-Prymnesium_polylepis.2
MHTLAVTSEDDEVARIQCDRLLDARVKRFDMQRRVVLAGVQDHQRHIGKRNAILKELLRVCGIPVEALLRAAALAATLRAAVTASAARRDKLHRIRAILDRLQHIRRPGILDLPAGRATQPTPVEVVVGLLLETLHLGRYSAP